jgi:hypothetical protein
MDEKNIYFVGNFPGRKKGLATVLKEEGDL